MFAGGRESPKLLRRNGSLGDQVYATKFVGKVEGAVSNPEGHGIKQADLHMLRQDIMADIRIEMEKMKKEIIEGKKKRLQIFESAFNHEIFIQPKFNFFSAFRGDMDRR